MTSSAPKKPRSEPVSENPTDDALPDDGLDEPEIESSDELEDETGIDLTDASDLDADNVPADEENDRVQQAPD
ncbi:MAG: hypothetical protein ABWZ88_22230 [Variovorax sp.]